MACPYKLSTAWCWQAVLSQCWQASTGKALSSSTGANTGDTDCQYRACIRQYGHSTAPVVKIWLGRLFFIGFLQKKKKKKKKKNYKAVKMSYYLFEVMGFVNSLLWSKNLDYMCHW